MAASLTRVESRRVQPELAFTVTAPSASRSGAEPAALSVGQQLGHYRVERKLGAGGMGEVYLATDLALDRPVALKVLPEDVGRDQAKRERLVREARSQARVIHPNVAHIYFIGEDAGRLYFAMEYVAGETLAARVAQGPMPVGEALSAIRSAALGLREAQRSGVTHRDVKPSNLMFDGSGNVKVLDFGLAASAPTEEIGDGPVQQTSMAGTPLYMAPEQARGEAIDFRADMYALGATLYQLVTGKPPFTAATAMELLTLHASAKRPVVGRIGKQPRTEVAAVDALIARMMAPAAKDRYASYDELVQAIELASTQHTRPAGAWARLVAAALDQMLLGVALLLGILLVSAVTDHEMVGQNLFIWAGVAGYQVIAIARWGKTLGMALFEIEVVDLATLRRPSWRCSLIRTSVMLGPVIALTAVSTILDVFGYESGAVEIASLVSVLLPVLVLFLAAWRSHGKRAVWDHAAKTMARYKR